MTPRLSALLMASLCLLLACSAPQGKPDGPPPPDGGEAVKAAFPYQRTVLENGLQIITQRDRSAPIAAVQLWYHVGSKDESPNRRGFAHMFEHMMFRGTPRLDDAEHMTLIQSTGGGSNAYTAFDQTVYVQTVLANQLELVMWLESERMAFLKIDPEGFVKERNIVKEEYHRTAEQPYGTLPDRLLAELFGGGLYSWSPIGDMDELASAELGELQGFWETYYVPNNAALVVVGDVEHEAVVALAQRYFGWIPRYPDKPAPKVARAPREEAPRKITLTEPNGPASIVGVAYRTVPSGHPDELPLTLLGQILGGGEASRVYHRLVVQEEAAMIALAGAISLEDEGLFAAGAVLAPLGGDLDEVKAALREEIERLREEGPTPAELERVRNQYARGLVTTQLTASGKAQLLGAAAVIAGDLTVIEREIAQVAALSVDDLKRVAVKHLDPSREIEIVVEPSMLGFLARQIVGGGGGQDEDASDDGEVAPMEARDWGKPGLIRPTTLPETPPIAAPIDAKVDRSFTRESLENGLSVVVVSDSEVPFVTLMLGMRAGGTSDVEGAPGTASFAASMLTRGTTRFDYPALSEHLALHAINVQGSADMDSLTVSASSVTEKAPLAFEMLAEVTRSPTFPADQLELLKKQFRTGRSITERSPDYLADRELRRRLYGDHPYARRADPEVGELDGVTSELLAMWWSDHAQPTDAVLYIAGDITSEEAVALAKLHFGDWESSPQPVGDSDRGELPTPEPTRIFLVDRPGEQSQIRVAQHGVTRQHPSYFTTRVLSQIFGGSGLSSWLNQSIRGELGLTYGAYGGFYARRFAGSFFVSTSSQNASTPRAIEAILALLERLRSEPPSAEEIERAKRYLLGNHVLDRETPQSIASDLWLIDSHDLPEDYFARYLGAVAATTPEDIVREARALIDPSTLIIVVVGPASELEAPLRAIAPVTIVD